MLEIQQWLEGILSKVTKHGLLQAGAHLGLLPCNNQVMAMCSLEHIQAHLPSITCLSLLIQAILLNLHLGDMPPIGTSQLFHHLNRLLRQVVMIITVNSLHSNSKPLVVLQLRQITLVTITVSHQLLAIINRDKVILKMAMVGIMQHLNLDMASHRHMISSKVMLLHLAMGM